ncbi:MAG: hypothetical protein QNJ34_28640 [Xenococcaceae cyanobacterium MO_188.B29]|nr:hypothetical protein [Xenococcaceae cyanobacterium MO_188.B29]
MNFAKVSEKQMHLLRWFLAIGWLVLITSLFYDPISAYLTEPHQLFGPKSADTCFEFQGQCYPLVPYPLGAKIFWGMVVPLSIITLLVFGHEVWRRICPLSFFSQIPRAMGWQQKRTIQENSWLYRNHLYLQSFLLFLGLNIRLLLVNSDRFLLGVFLLLTIFSAIIVGFLYDGKTWCHYFCPMAPVQTIYSEPSGLLSSEAHTTPSRSITQSMCRTTNESGSEKSTCVGCKSACMDIDAENSYWSKIERPDQKLLRYAYLGLAIGFYLYFGLYSGNWNFLAAGVWNETNHLSTLFAPGFYINGQALPIPKILAVPLTLSLSSGITYILGLRIEKAYKRHNQKLKRPLSLKQINHRLFTLFSFAAFNSLFFLGVYPTLGWLPWIGQQLLSWGALLASILWLVKVWQRSKKRYLKERDGNLLRRQLQKLEINLSRHLDGRSLNELKTDELYALAKLLPDFSNSHRLQLYSDTIKEALEQRRVTISRSLEAFQSLRQELEISKAEHWKLIERICQDNTKLFAVNLGQISDTEVTVISPLNPNAAQADMTVKRPFSQVKTERIADLNSPNSPTIKPTKSEIEPTVRRSDSTRNQTKENQKR